MFPLANMGRGTASPEPFNVCSTTRATEDCENAMGSERSGESPPFIDRTSIIETEK